MDNWLHNDQKRHLLIEVLEYAGMRKEAVDAVVVSDMAEDGSRLVAIVLRPKKQTP